MKHILKICLLSGLLTITLKATKEKNQNYIFKKTESINTAEYKEEDLKSFLLLYGDYYQEENTLHELDPFVLAVYLKAKNNEPLSLDDLSTAVKMLNTRCNRLDAIYEKVQEIYDIIVPDAAGTITALNAQTELMCEKFNFTWTMLDQLFSTTINIEPAIEEAIQELNYTFTALDYLENLINEKFAYTWTQLQCPSPTPISAPTTISNPGTYCVVQNISGLITINADNVILDLQNKTISSAATLININNQENITIKNGIIEMGSSNAVAITNGNNIQLFDIDFISNATAVTILTSTNVSLQNCTFNNNTQESLVIDTSNAVSIKNATFFNNTGNSIILAQNSFCLNFTDLICNNNTLTGIGTNFNFLNTKAVEFDNCSINNYTVNRFTGWQLNNCDTISFYRSSANNITTTNGPLSGIIIQNNSTNIAGEALSFSNNNSLFTNKGVAIDSCSNITFADTHITYNSGNGVFGITTSNVDSLLLKRCRASNLTGAGTLNSGFSLDISTNAQIIECSADELNATTNSSDSAIGFNLNYCSQVLLSNCSSSLNIAPSVRGVRISGITSDITLEKSIFNDLIGGQFHCYGVFVSDLASNIAFIECTSSRNTSTSSSNTVGFFVSSSSTNNIREISFNKCIANDNTGITSAEGFYIINSQNISVIKSYAQNNHCTSTSLAAGIYIQTSVFTTVKGCITTNNTNTGGLPDDSVGVFIENSSSITNNWTNIEKNISTNNGFNMRTAWTRGSITVINNIFSNSPNSLGIRMGNSIGSCIMEKNQFIAHNTAVSVQGLTGMTLSKNLFVENAIDVTPDPLVDPGLPMAQFQNISQHFGTGLTIVPQTNYLIRPESRINNRNPFVNLRAFYF